VDSKGRISIPAVIRKNYNLEYGTKMTMIADLRNNFFVLLSNGRGGVNSGTRDYEIRRKCINKKAK